jgi:hypothetical protein
MTLFLLKTKIKISITEDIDVNFKTYSSTQIFCLIVKLDKFGIVEINKSSLSLIHDDIVGTKISMKNLLLKHQRFMGYRHLSVFKFLMNIRGTYQPQGQKNID